MSADVNKQKSIVMALRTRGIWLSKRVYSEAATVGVLWKVALRNFAKLTGKHLSQSLFFNKGKGLRPATLLKIDTLAQVFSYEFCEIFKSTFFTEYVWVTVSIYLTKMKYLEILAA